MQPLEEVFSEDTWLCDHISPSLARNCPLLPHPPHSGGYLTTCSHFTLLEHHRTNPVLRLLLFLTPDQCQQETWVPSPAAARSIGEHLLEAPHVSMAN